MSNKLFSGGKSFGKGTVNAELNDPELIDILSAYRRKVAGNYRSLLLDDFGSLPSSGLLVSSKIDGELWFLVSSQKMVFLTNTRGVVIHGDIPVLQQGKSLPENTIIAGELYAQVEGRRSRVGDLAALLASTEPSDSGKLSFGAFDLIGHPDGGADGNYPQRYALLNSLITSTDQLKVLQCEEMDRTELLTKFESEVVTGKLEGLVIRLPTGLIYKLKPAITIDAVVIAYTAKTDQPDSARSILLGLMYPDGGIQIFGGCGNLGSDGERKSLYTQLSALKVAAPIRYASDSGALYTFVKPEVVVEVKVTDLQIERSDGSNSSAMILAFKDASWSAVRLSPCPRPIHPVLVRVRAGKSVNETDVRIAQIDGFIDVKNSSISADERPTSKVVRREVWTKETKGVVAVRKLLVWKTNKETVSSAYPAYVVHWTDFSPGRGSPLNREVKPAPDEETAMKISVALIEENIKKGWVEVKK